MVVLPDVRTTANRASSSWMPAGVVEARPAELAEYVGVVPATQVMPTAGCYAEAAVKV